MSVETVGAFISFLSLFAGRHVKEVATVPQLSACSIF